jgi:pimeloyl-ACP methyl ester carboxylesterase
VGVFFFACNVDASGTWPFQANPEIDRIYSNHVRDYAKLSPTPGAFEKMRDDLGVMQADQPGYTAADLNQIRVPVWSVVGERETFVKREHMEYIAHTIPRARFLLLPQVSHFAPLQRPDDFNAAVLDFLSHLAW